MIWLMMQLKIFVIKAIYTKKMVGYSGTPALIRLIIPLKFQKLPKSRGIIPLPDKCISQIFKIAVFSVLVKIAKFQKYWKPSKICTFICIFKTKRENLKFL